MKANYIRAALLGITILAGTPATRGETVGEQRTLVTLVNFQNDLSTPFTTLDAEQAILDTGNPASTATYIDELSYGRAWLTGDVFGWFTVDWDDTACVASVWVIRDMIVAELDPTVDFTQYDRWIIVSPPNAACSYSGISTLGKESFDTADGTVQISRINLNGLGASSGALTLHEMGHSLAGLQHSRDYECGVDVIRDTCSAAGLGSVTDRYDAMGFGQASGHFSPPNKDTLGWLDTDVVEVAAPGGSFSLLPYETYAPGLKVLRIPVTYQLDDFGATDYYYVSYRKPTGFDAAFPELAIDGAMVHVDAFRQTDGVVRRTGLLDMSPNLNPDAASQITDTEDVLLGIGQVYVDTEKGITLTVDGVTAGRLIVSVAISKYCGNGVLEPEIGEACDGANLGTATCTSLGRLEGNLQCSGTCMFDEASCGLNRCGAGHAFDLAGTCTATILADPADGGLWRSRPSFTEARESTVANNIFEETWISPLVAQQADGYSWIYRNSLPFDTTSIPDGSTLLSGEILMKIVQQGGLTNTHPDSSDTLVLVRPTLANPPQLQTADFDQFGALDNPVEGAARIDVGDELSIGLIKSWPLNGTGLGWIDDQGWSMFGIRQGFDVDDIFFPGEEMRLDVQILSSDSLLYGPRLAVEYGAAAIPAGGAAGRVPDGAAGGEPLRLTGQPDGTLTLSWGTTCGGADSDYAVYEGVLGNFASHVPRTCTTGGATSQNLTPGGANRYYLVVPRTADREGSYGLDSGLAERPAGTVACVPQEVLACGG